MSLSRSFHAPVELDQRSVARGVRGPCLTTCHKRSSNSAQNPWRCPTAVHGSDQIQGVTSHPEYQLFRGSWHHFSQTTFSSPLVRPDRSSKSRRARARDWSKDLSSQSDTDQMASHLVVETRIRDKCGGALKQSIMSPLSRPERFLQINIFFFLAFCAPVNPHSTLSPWDAPCFSLVGSAESPNLNWN